MLVSHFHTDHVAGLISKDGLSVFANAKVLVPNPELTYRMDDEREKSAPANLQPYHKLSRRVMSALSTVIRVFEWGQKVLPGIVAIQADSHTPGQTAFKITLGSDQLLYVAEITNNPMVFARHPDWSASFDMDPARSVAHPKDNPGQSR